MKTVYAAGPITGTTYQECTGWRLELASYLPPDVRVLSPLRAKTYLRDEKVIGDQYTEHIMSTQRGITIRDRWDTICSDCLVVNLLGATRVSIGTMIELGWADRDERRKPIIGIMEKEGNLHDHSMVREILSYRVESVREAAYVVRALFNIDPAQHDKIDGLVKENAA